MKKKLTLKMLLKAFAISSLVFTIPACTINIDDIKGDELQPTLSFAQATVTTSVGESFRLNPIIANLQGTDLVDYSFDKEGYILFENGEFRAIREGNVVINASLKGYADVKATVSVRINPASQVSGVKIAASYQGSYVFDKQEIIIHESSIEILENGASVTFEIKQDANGYYFETGSDRLSISFEADDKVKIDNTVFSKKSGNTNQDKYTKASIPDALLGQYSAYGFNLTVNRDNLELVSEGMTLRYWVYTENNAYFFVVQDGAGNDIKTLISFGNDSVSFEGTTYTRNGQTQQHVIAHLPGGYIGSYGDEEGTYVELRESSVLVKEDGKELLFDLYVDGDGQYYIIDGTEIVYCYLELDVYVKNKYGTFYKIGYQGDVYDLAHLPNLYQGTYTSNKIVVQVLESSVVVIENGKSNTYSLYIEGNSYFVVEDGRKVYCTFSADGSSVTNDFGTFTKQQTPTYDIAHLPSMLQGEYFSGSITVKVFESKVVVMEEQKTNSYDLYFDGTNYFVVEEGRKVYCTFSAEGSSVTNDFGTFTKKSGSSQQVTLPSEYHGVYKDDDGVINITITDSYLVISSSSSSSPMYTFEILHDGKDYYVIDGEGEKEVIKFANGYLIIDNSRYQKDNTPAIEYEKARLDKTYQGSFYGYTNGLIISAQVHENSIDFYVGEETITLTVYQVVNGSSIDYYFGQDGEYISLVINESKFTAPGMFDFEFTREYPSQGDLIDEAYQGNYYFSTGAEGKINISIDSSSLHLFVEGTEAVYLINQDDSGYYIEIDGDIQYISFGQGSVTIGELVFTKDSQGGQGQTSNLPKEYLGTYYSNSGAIIVYDSYVMLLSSEGSTSQSNIILSDDKIYYIEYNASYMTIQFIDGYYVLLGETVYTKDSSSFAEVIPDDYQGLYYSSDNYVLTINGNNIIVVGENMQITYIVVEKDGKLYVAAEDMDMEIIFTDDGVQIGDELYVREDEEEPDPEQTYFEGEGWPQEYLSKEYPGLRISQIPSRNATYMYEYSVGEYFNIGYEGVTEQEFASWVTSLQRSNFKLIEEGYFTCLVASENYYIEMFCDEDSLTIAKYVYEGDETSFPSESIRRTVGDLGIPELQASSYLTYLEDGISIIAFGVEQETFENYVISLQKNESFELVEHEEESLEYYYSVGNCAMYLGYESTSYIATLLIYPEE